MPAILEAINLHRWAMQCATEADNLGASEDERTRLLKMHEALLVLADSANWFCGITMRNPRPSKAAI